MESIRALEELVCTATAAQAALAVELDASLRAAAAEAGVRADDQDKGIGHVVAAARRESPHRGQRHLGLAKVALTELPHTWAAWRSGRVTEWTATIIARETACLSLTDRLAVDELIASDADALEAMGVGELSGRVRSAAERLDPAAAVKRRRQAESQRRVSLRPAPDTMTWLTALLPVKDGVAVLAALTRAAEGARSRGDERSQGQVMADSLVDGVLGSATEGEERSDRPAVELGLVMSDRALVGESEEAAHLGGFGPIPAELARELVAGALDDADDVWLRRLYAHPTTGELVQMDSRARLFPSSLAKLIKLRDQTCRTPWCDAPIRHIDHVEGHASGGRTSRRNGQGLCEACNHAKQAHRWRARPGPDGDVTTTHPTGHRHTTRPPAWSATLTRRDLPTLTIDYVLTAVC